MILITIEVFQPLGETYSHGEADVSQVPSLDLAPGLVRRERASIAMLPWRLASVCGKGSCGVM